MKYKTANECYKEMFGHKMYRAAISLVGTCPNRDGNKGVGGCAFCSADGSGEFASSYTKPVITQIDEAINKVAAKVDDSTRFIAYFQSFTSTYCSSSTLRKALDEAMSHPLVEGISIATRPDCLPEDILEVIKEAASKMPVFVELGLQTSSDVTADSFGRGYKTEEYIAAVSNLKAAGANVITHIILGLPGESLDAMLDSVRCALDAGTDGLKFTCLFILEGTRYESLWREGKIDVLGMEEYFDIVDKILDIVPYDVPIHRITGDGPKRILIAPEWTKNKRMVINYINKRFS